jgi:hypothetical protein
MPFMKSRRDRVPWKVAIFSPFTRSRFAGEFPIK